MGGNVFKSLSVSESVQIKKDEVLPTLHLFERDVLEPSGIFSYHLVGSSCLKPLSNDVDIAVGPFDLSTSQKRSFAKKDLLQKFEKALNNRGKASLVGSLVSVLFPIFGRENEKVQIDVILSENPQNTAWLLSGGTLQVKGVYRNLLLSYLAKSQSNDKSKKITISYPGGVTIKSNGKTLVERDERPQTILDALGLHCKPSDSTTFEGLVTILANSGVNSDHLQGYQSYIKSFIDNESTSNGALDSIRVMRKILSL